MIRVEERHGKDSGIFFEPHRVLYHRASRYQDILVVETRDYGRVLLLDGLVMTTEKDEFFYHEALVHPAMQHHPDPRKVLVLGGGDGGTVREVLRYAGVARVVVVEIDPDVVEVARMFFPDMADVLFQGRVEVLHEDAARYVATTEEKFDVVILDTSDPVGPAQVFYTPEFFQNLTRVLEPVSVVAIQAESPIFHRDRVREVYTLASRTFKTVKVYTAPTPTYPGGMWAFVLASIQPSLPAFRQDVPEGLQFYNAEIHRALFQLPTFLRDLLATASPHGA